MVNMYEYNALAIYKDKRLGVIRCGNGFTTEFSAPPEFHGMSKYLTPEDSFVASIAMCFILTFESICRKMRIPFISFECECKGVLDKVDGREEFTRVIVRPKIVVSKNLVKIEKAIKLTEENCLITNSIKSEIVVKPEIRRSDEN